MAKVAIVTRTLNRPAFLRRAIASVLAQTCGDWTHVIVNDGGEREPVESLVREHAERYAGRVQVLHHEARRGMEAASNSGIRASDSEFIVIHDDDDTWEPLFLERCLGVFSRPEGQFFSGVVSQINLVAETIRGDRIRVISKQPHNPWLRSFRLPANFGFFDEIFSISFLYKRKALDEIGWYNEDMPVQADIDFNIRFLSRYNIYAVNEPLANYHQRKPDAEGPHHNTVVAQQELHFNMRAAIFNRYLREDLASNRIGIGFLLNGLLRDPNPKLDELHHTLGQINGWLAQLDARVGNLDHYLQKLISAGKRLPLVGGIIGRVRR
ncbi:MAG: glycosyltransferase family 2 protein [Myxococcales bacterium]|nr:MAG: glycosyltransferase family 2 protein [Myxococcales bacterium]